MKYTNLVPGQYYKAKNNEKWTWYIQFKEIKDKIIHTSICLTDNGHFFKNSKWAHVNDDFKFTSATSQEIEWMKKCAKEDKYLPIKQTNMTKIAIKKARNWPTEDLKNGQEFTTAQGKIQIVKNKSSIYIVHNSPAKEGLKPRTMPAGFKYGYCIDSATFSSTQDLTCGYFTAFKQEDVVKNMRFTGMFKVAGVVSLLKALKEEAEALGWKFTGEDISKNTQALIFDEGEFYISPDNIWANYSLAYEWDQVLENLKEQEEVDDCEYVECIEDNPMEGITLGRIYKRDLALTDEDCYYIEPDYDGGNNYHLRESFKPSTQEAYEAQGPNISSVGGYKINIKEVKINGYQPMKMACIGCADSQQVYSLGALSALYEVMCGSEATYKSEDVTFTREQVSALIDTLS